MNTNFPSILARLIPRLSSPRAIERALKSEKLDWHDLAAGVAAASSSITLAESPRAMEIRAWLEAVSRERWLNAWMREFVSDMLVRESLDRISPKQGYWIHKIISEAYQRGVRP